MKNETKNQPEMMLPPALENTKETIPKQDKPLWHFPNYFQFTLKLARHFCWPAHTVSHRDVIKKRGGFSEAN